MTRGKIISGYECEIKDGKIHAVFVDVPGQGKTRMYPYLWNNKTLSYNNKDISETTFRKYCDQDDGERRKIVFK